MAQRRVCGLGAEQVADLADVARDEQLDAAAAEVAGERSRKLLDELRSWMSAHNAAVMAVITLGVKLLGDGIAGL